jgi:translation elongation factor EF-G
MNNQLSTPAQYLGTIVSDLSSTRRGQVKEVVGTADSFGGQLITAFVPLKGKSVCQNVVAFVEYVFCLEMIGYSTVLRSLTKGGHYTAQNCVFFCILNCTFRHCFIYDGV